VTEQPALVVVADRFDDFLGNRGTVGITGLLSSLRDPVAVTPMALVIGQGLSAAELDELASAADRANIEVFGGGVPRRVERALTHKHNARNVLIDPPVRTDREGVFEVPLLLDAYSDMLSDHLTGQHIPAVTLLEAARQTWTVVTEEFLRPSDPTDPQRFVIASFTSAFHRFVFPLPATLQYELHTCDPSSVGTAISCTIGIYQQGVLAAEISASYRLVPELVSRKQESMAARQAVRDELTAVAATPSAGRAA
jgi:hypothetical protein